MNSIAIIDADLIGRKNHRFPNLCCMKLSGWHKAQGDRVTLKTDYDGLDKFDRVYVAKVFSDTKTPALPDNVVAGGTGFFYDNAPPLPHEVEHHMPDYHLYDGTCDFKTYTDYSIGYLTRGCFRRCPFCVNRRKDKVVAHSPLKEFLDTTRKKICLLDDNFFGYDGWQDLLIELRNTGKPFVFKQGLDVRLLDELRAELLLTAKYDGDFIFAFDDVSDAPIIEEKIQLISRYVKLSNNRVKFYVLCGYDRSGRYDANFWQRDLQSVFDRVDLLKRNRCLPYIMRHKDYLNAPPHCKHTYTELARWCNQPQFFLKMTFDEFNIADAQYELIRKERRRERANNLDAEIDGHNARKSAQRPEIPRLCRST